MIPNLVERMRQAELSTSLLPWPDTRYRTIRRRDNRQAAEVAAEVAEDFYAPLVDVARRIYEAQNERTTDQEALEELSEVFNRLCA